MAAENAHLLLRGHQSPEDSVSSERGHVMLSGRLVMGLRKPPSAPGEASGKGLSSLVPWRISGCTPCMRQPERRPADRFLFGRRAGDTPSRGPCLPTSSSRPRRRRDWPAGSPGKLIPGSLGRASGLLTEQPANTPLPIPRCSNVDDGK